MKLALVRARYSPFGGAEQFATRAMAALAAGGAEITIIARRWRSASHASRSPGDGIFEKTRFLRCDPFYLGSLWRDISFAAAVHGALAREAFDLVQSHERIVGLPIYRAGDGVHAVWLERRGAFVGATKRWGMKLNPHHRYLQWVERKMFEHPALRAVICNSQMVRDEIQQRFSIDPDKLHVIANGIDLEYFRPCIPGTGAGSLARARFEKVGALGIGPATPCFVLVGSGFERKGVATALEALAIVDESLGAKATLIVVGGDKHIGRYRALARRLGVLAHFAGEDPDVRSWFAIADGFLLPSIYDPFPNAALEALACGVPVIVSNACGIREVVRQGQSGWVCAAGDPRALAAAMIELCACLADAGRVAELRTAARAAAEPYSLSALSEALRSLYMKLVQHGS